MSQQTPRSRVLFPHSQKAVGKLVFVVFLISVLAASVASLWPSQPAAAATSSTINFQARLQTASGALVPDGYYNVQFKLYDAATSGTNLWTESYYDSNGVTAGNDNRVRVKNGYLTVNLGSQTAFGALNWDQEMWLTMNVGGTTQTATPTYDGEMNPRLKLTAAPYALKAGDSATLGGITASGFIQNTTSVQSSASIAIQSAADANITAFFQGRTNQSVATLQIQNGSTQGGDYLKVLNGSGGDVLRIDGFGNVHATGQANIDGIVGIGTIASAGTQLRLTAASGNIALEAHGNGTQDILNLYSGNSNTLVTKITDNGSATFQNNTDSTTAFAVKNSSGAGGATVLGVDTSNKAVNTGGDLNVGTAANRGGAGRLFSDGFESGNFSLWSGSSGITGGSTVAADTATARNGKYAAKFTQSAGAARADTGVTLGTSFALRSYVYVSTQGSNNLDIMRVTTSGATYLNVFREQTTGILKVTNSANSTNYPTSGGTALTTGTWHKVELVATINGSTGSLTLYLDDVSVATVSGIDTGSTGGVTLTIGDTNSRTNTFYIDDVSADTVRPGDSANLNVNDSLHVAGASTFGGAALFQAASNSTTAFQIQNAAGTSNVFTADTTNNRIGINTAAPSEALTVNGNFSVRDADTPTKQYRFRTSGGALDFEAAGAQLFLSNWQNADYTGTQRTYLVLENGASIAQAIGSWQFRTTSNGTARHTIDGTTGADVAFNQNGEATNFSVQGDTDANLLYVKGSTDRVGIGTNGPGYKLDVQGGDINTSANLRTGGTIRLDNAGALSNITGYAQSSGNFLQSGAGTFGTGTGAVSLNGDTTVAAGKNLVLASGTGTFTQTYAAASGTAATINANATASNTVTNGLNVNAGGAGTVTNGISVSQAAGTLTNGLAFSGTIGTDITRGSGTLTLQGAGGVTVTATTGNISLAGDVSVTGSITGSRKLTLSGTFTTTDNARLYVTGTLNSSATSSQYGIQNDVNFNPSGASLSSIYGFVNTPNISGSSLNISNFMGGVMSVSTGAGYTGTVSSAIGLQVSSPTIGGSNKFNSYSGINVASNSANGGNTSGTITNRQLEINGVTAGAGAGGTVNNYGIDLTMPSGSGGTTNNYGLRITGNGGGSSSYGVYNSSTAANYMQGNTSIGTSSNPNNYALNVNGTANATGYAVGATAGASISCSSTQSIKNTTVSGGIVTGGTCGTAGTASTMQDAYDGSGTTSPQIQLSSTNGGLKIKDGATPVSGNLMQFQNSAGTATYFGLSTTGLSMQDSSGNNAWAFDITGDTHLKLYANTATPTLYADIYYDTTNSQAVFAASSGTTRVGKGGGNIDLLLNTADSVNATKTDTLAGAYSTNDFNISEVLTGGSNSISGSVLNVESLSTTSGSNSQNILRLNQNSSGATGNLLVAYTSGSVEKFKVTNSGNVSNAGGVTIGSGQSYSGSGAVTLSSASGTALTVTGNAASTWSTSAGALTLTSAAAATWGTSSGNLTLQAGGANAVIVKPGSNSTNSFQVQNSSGTAYLTADTSNVLLQVGSSSSDSTAVLLTLDSYNTATDPTGVAGAMYYNTALNKFRCYQDSVWKNCIGTDVSAGFALTTDLVGNPSSATDYMMSSISGTGASVASAAISATNRPGVYQSTTGTTAAGRVSYTSGMTNPPLALGSGKTVFETAINIGTLSNGTDRYQLIVGFLSTLSAANQTNAVAFVYDEGGVSTGSAASGNWQLMTANNSTRTFSTTSTAVAAGSWVKLRIEVNAAGTLATYYVNGTSVGTISTNLPTGTTRPVGFGTHMVKSVGTTARTLSMDYFDVNQDFTTAR